MVSSRGVSMTAGHTDAPNIRYFIQWADKFIGHSAAFGHAMSTAGCAIPALFALSFAVSAQAPGSASTPASRTDANSLMAHAQLLEKTKKGVIDVYFEGDSIARRWGATDYPDFLANWNRNFHGWNAADFGWGADKVENVLWRLEHGELDGVNPAKIIVLLGRDEAMSVTRLPRMRRRLRPGSRIFPTASGLF